MACPWFEVKSIGVCMASKFPYDPGLTELERFCFRDDFANCPFYYNSFLREGR
jgi:hypothetical protein